MVHGSVGTEIESEMVNGRDGPEDLNINGKIISRHISRDRIERCFYDKLLSVIIFYF
jgi:hypothetical protein